MTSLEEKLVSTFPDAHARADTINIMVWNAARGGMRTVVEQYRADGLLTRERFRLVAAYTDGGFVKRQIVCLSALARFVWLLVFKRVGLVHIHAAMYGSFWRKAIFAVLARRFRVPVILHLHGSEMQSFYKKLPSFAKRLVARQLELAARVMVLSQSWKVFVNKISPSASVDVVPNYITLGTPSPGGNGEVTHFAFLGALGRRKGIYDLIAAIAKAKSGLGRCLFSIGGDGELAEAQAMARQLGVDDIMQFRGWLDGEQRAELLQTTDVFLLPSYNEGLPMSLLEAMSCAIPVITTPVGGIPELVTDGVEGLLVRPGDIDGLAAALIKGATDGAWRKGAGKAAYERVSRQYAREQVLPKISALYRDTIHAASGRK